jgi:hypothetical protein
LLSHLSATAESILLNQLHHQQGHLLGLDCSDDSSKYVLSSRLLLLALGWLTFNSRLFEDAIMHLHPSAELRCMLEPLPEVIAFFIL